MDINDSTTPDDLDVPIKMSDKPTLPLLTYLPTTSSGLGVCIIERSQSHYKDLGILLLDDKEGDKTTSSQMAEHYHPKDVTRSIFTKWLTRGGGKEPITWATFVAVLKKIGLRSLAVEIEAVAGLPKEEEAKAVPDPLSHAEEQVTDVQQPHAESPEPSAMTIDYVKDKIRVFEERFEKLRDATATSLEKRPVLVGEIVNSLTLMPADEKEEHEQFLSKNLKELYSFSSVPELIGKLSLEYIDFFSYQLLDYLVKKFKLEVNQKMEVYKVDLQRFLSKTPLKLYCKSQKRRKRRPPDDFKLVVAEFEWPDEITMEVVEEFREEYAFHYRLRECALLLDEIKIGCVIVVWFIPGSIVDKLTRDIPVDLLRRYSTTKLEISGVTVYQRQAGRTALHDAAESGDVETVKNLLSTTDINATTANDGATALLLASRQGHVEIVQLLLHANAMITITDKDGFSPLYIACLEGHTDVVNTLVKAGANVNQEMTEAPNNVPLIAAAEKGHYYTVETLLNEGAFVNYSNKDGCTALFYAAWFGHSEVVRLLLRKGAEDNQNKSGKTAMDMARKRQHKDVIQHLESVVAEDETPVGIGMKTRQPAVEQTSHSTSTVGGGSGDK